MKNNFIQQVRQLLLAVNFIFATTLMAQTPGAALRFDGVNDFVMINHNSAFNFSNAFTIEAWIRTNQQATGHIANKIDDSFYFAVNGEGTTSSSGKLSFFCNGITSSWLTGTVNVADNAWHHVAVVYDGSQIALYVDGNLDKVNTASGTANTGTSTVLLGYRYINQLNIQVFDGSMDELRFWNKARTECEIKSFMRCEITSTASGLVANYHFNHGVLGASNSTANLLADATAANTGTLYMFALNGGFSDWIATGGVLSGSNTPASVLPVSVVANPTNLCAGENLTLTANGAQSFSWSTGQTTNSVVLTPTATTIFSLTGHNGDCIGTASTQVTVDLCTHLESALPVALMSIYPVPAQTKLTFNTKTNGLLVITNLQGKVLWTETVVNNSTEVICEEWPKGLYLATFSTASGQQNFKIIKD